MSRIARLAAAKGGKTRAILKLAGRGAILLTVSAFNLAMWMFWAVLTVFGFVSSLKRAAERTTERYCLRRKRRLVRAREREAEEQRLAALAAAAEEPPVIYSTAPGIAPAEEPAPPLPLPWAPQLEPAGRVIVQRPSRTVLGAARQPTRAPLESAMVSFRGASKARAGGS